MAWESLLDYLPEAAFSVAGLLAGHFWGKWQARKEWKQKVFTRQVVLSLNIWEESSQPDKVGALKLRTIFESSLQEVLPNPIMQNLVLRGLKETTKNDPLIRLPESDRWYVLNRILNYIGERFAEGFFRQDMGLETHKRRYIFCLTYERNGGIRAQKVRIMIMDKEKFLSFPEEGEFELENPQYHIVRVHTLQKLKELYQKDPSHFMEMELIF